MQKCFPAYLPIPKCRVGVLHILNLKTDPLLETLSIIFSEQGNMKPPGATLSHSGFVVGGSQYGVWIFFLIKNNIDIYDVYCRIRTNVLDRGTVVPDNSLHRHAQHVNVKCTNLLSF